MSEEDNQFYDEFESEQEVEDDTDVTTDQRVIQPYLFEPEAGDEGEDWANSNENEEPEINVEGRAGNCDWCTCGNLCKSMPSDEESRCCNENENVKTVKTSEYACVTQNPSFNKLILDRELLQMVLHGLALKTKSQRKRRLLTADAPQNRTWRYAAYKQFTSWINAWTAIGFKNRIVLPACVVWKIRDEFPEEDQNYTGFKNSVGGGRLPQ